MENLDIVSGLQEAWEWMVEVELYREKEEVPSDFKKDTLEAIALIKQHLLDLKLEEQMKKLIGSPSPIIYSPCDVKAAISIALDVGPSMVKGTLPLSMEKAFSRAYLYITELLEEESVPESSKVFLVKFGTAGTKNPLAEGESYKNVKFAVPYHDIVTNMFKASEISSASGDFIDAVMLAIDHVDKEIQNRWKKGFASRRLLLLTDFGGEVSHKKIDAVVAAITQSKTKLFVIGLKSDETQPQQHAGQAVLQEILRQVGQERNFISEIVTARPTVKHSHVDVSQESGMKDVASAKVTVVETPEELINILISRWNEDKYKQGKLHQNIMNRCLPELVRNIDLEKVLKYIKEKKLLNDVTILVIMESGTRDWFMRLPILHQRRIRELIKQIQQRDEDTYEEFKVCLFRAGHVVLKDMLEREEAEEQKQCTEKQRLTSKIGYEVSNGTKEEAQTFVQGVEEQNVEQPIYENEDKDPVPDDGVSFAVAAESNPIQASTSAATITTLQGSSTQTMQPATTSPTATLTPSTGTPQTASMLATSTASSTTLIPTETMTGSSGATSSIQETPMTTSDISTTDIDQDMATKLINIIRKDKFSGMEEIFQDERYLAKSIILHAVRKCGLSNKFVQWLLRGMSNRLKKKIPNAKTVWCGYRPLDPDTPLFVSVIHKHTRVPEKSNLPRIFNDYEIVYRYEHTPNDEETFIAEKFEETVSNIFENNEKVMDCIARNAEGLMQKHSNLSMITASSVKAIGFNGQDDSLKLNKTECVVLYVPLKGIIPVGEEEFWKDIEGIPTDVREGEFVIYAGRRAEEWLPKLNMGCCISTKDQQTGTLGGFIELPDDKIGFITAAHVVLKEEERRYYAKSKPGNKSHYNDLLAKGKKKIQIYQPSPSSDACGMVRRVVYEQGNKSNSSVDVALIEITDETRKPNIGIFPSDNSSQNFKDYVNPKEHLNSFQPRCSVVKCGMSTGITIGCLLLNEGYVQTVNSIGKPMNRKLKKNDNVKLYKQFMVQTLDEKFAEPGDSGALVFHCKGENVRNLKAVGMLIGASTNEDKGCKCFVTPIKGVFEQLCIKNITFKCFPEMFETDEINSLKQRLQMKLLKESLKNIEKQIEEQKQELTKLIVNMEKKSDDNFNKVMAKLSELSK